MRMHFICVPVLDGGAAEGELNRFLASNRVLAVERQLVVDGTRSAWAVCVSYVEGGGGPGNRDPNLGFRLARAQRRVGEPATDPSRHPTAGPRRRGEKRADADVLVARVDALVSARRRSFWVLEGGCNGR